jgi:hypothetical protein
MQNLFSTNRRRFGPGRKVPWPCARIDFTEKSFRFGLCANKPPRPNPPRLLLSQSRVPGRRSLLFLSNGGDRFFQPRIQLLPPVRAPGPPYRWPSPWTRVPVHVCDLGGLLSALQLPRCTSLYGTVSAPGTASGALWHHSRRSGQVRNWQMSSTTSSRV